MRKVTGQEALSIINKGGSLIYGDNKFYKIENCIYYKSGKPALKLSKLNDEDIKKIDWYIEEPEYNLTIQQVLQKENIGKYYTSDINDEVILWLTGSIGNLELTVVKDPDLDEEELYCLADEMYNLGFIVSSMYKEVDFKC